MVKLLFVGMVKEEIPKRYVSSGYHRWNWTYFDVHFVPRITDDISVLITELRRLYIHVTVPSLLFFCETNKTYGILG